MTTKRVQWDNINAIPKFSPVPHIWMQLLAGEQIMLNKVTLEPGGIVPMHSHANEQCGLVLSGVLILTLDGETRHLTEGDCYMIPAHVEHAGETDDKGCVILDIFSPPREDYVALQVQARSESGS